jgi:predicted DNA-binding transcriptional regulator YafY
MSIALSKREYKALQAKWNQAERDALRAAFVRYKNSNQKSYDTVAAEAKLQKNTILDFVHNKRDTYTAVLEALKSYIGIPYDMSVSECVRSVESKKCRVVEPAAHITGSTLAGVSTSLLWAHELMTSKPDYAPTGRAAA